MGQELYPTAAILEILKDYSCVMALCLLKDVTKMIESELEQELEQLSINRTLKDYFSGILSPEK